MEKTDIYITSLLEQQRKENMPIKEAKNTY